MLRTLNFYVLAAIVVVGMIGIGPAHAQGCEGITTVAGTTVASPVDGSGGGHHFDVGQKLDYLLSGWINPDHSVATLTTGPNDFNYPVQDVKLTNCHIDPGGGVPSLQPNQVSVPVAPPPSTPTQAQIQAAQNAASNADSCVGMTTASGLTQEGTSFTAGYIIDWMSVFQTNQDDTVAWYGEQGGYTYPAQDVEVLNCHVQTDASGNTTLAFNNTEAGQTAQVQNNTEQELELAGLDDADAGNFATYAYEHPQSKCANDVGTALNAVQILNAAANTPSDEKDDRWQSTTTSAQQNLSNAESQAGNDCK